MYHMIGYMGINNQLTSNRREVFLPPGAHKRMMNDPHNVMAVWSLV